MTDPLHSSIFGDPEPESDASGHAAGAGRPDAPVVPERPSGSARARRRAAKRARRSHRPSAARRFGVIFVALAVVAVGVIAAFTVLRPLVEGWGESNDYPGPGTGEVRVKVEPGAGGSAIARKLFDQGVVKSSKAFLDAASDEPRSAAIQPGTYELQQQMRAVDALGVLIDPGNRITTSVTIPEGLWATETYERLSTATGLPVANYEAAAKDGAALGLPPSANGNVEGYLFPASYDFEPDTTAAEHLKLMVAQAVKRLTALGVAPERMEHVVIVASLVEAEARLPADRPKVARVIENRLAEEMPLQLDSTVNYAVGKHGITTSDQDRASTSPYNTYKVVGLPPGPIGNPGESAIEAAAKPVAGPWLFFVTVNPTDGTTKFATTFEEHQRNVLEFQAWCQANQGTC